MTNVLTSIAGFALPPRCAGCGLIVSDDLQLCLACWESLSFLTGSGCELCGSPIAADHAICAPCLQNPPDHDGAHACVVYGDVARNIALRLKHGRRIGLAKLIAKLMVRRLPSEPGILVPVPLHRWRILRRGFNQSALVAGHLAKTNGLRLEIDALRRDRSTPLLRGFNAQERSKAVRGAFSVSPEARPRLKDQTVFLIDDVYTSGATANACARVLKRSGVSKVVVFCWARVVFEAGAD
jgi:ComF family protein